MDDSRGVLLLTERFENHVIALRPVIVDQVVDVAIGLHHQGVRSLADLALERLPEVGREVGGDLGLLASFQPVLQAHEMDAADGTPTLASAEKRILLVGVRTPAEAAFMVWIVRTQIFESGWNRCELLELLRRRIRENTICAVAFFYFFRGVDVHLLSGVANLFDGKFDAAYLQNIVLLDLVVNFLVVNLEATHDKEHGLLGALAARLVQLEVLLVVLIGSALQVECLASMIDNLEHGHVLLGLLGGINLLLEASLVVIMDKRQVVAISHNHGLVLSLERLLCQVTALIVEEAVAVTAPSDAFHQNNMGVKVLGDRCVGGLVNVLGHRLNQLGGTWAELWLLTTEIGLVESFLSDDTGLR